MLTHKHGQEIDLLEEISAHLHSKEDEMKSQLALLAIAALSVCANDDFKILQIVVEAAQEVSHELTYTNESTNFETGKPEYNYFQPPSVTKRIKRGDCKDYAIYLDTIVKERCSSNNLNPNFYVVFGHLDGNGHAWNYLVLGTNEFYLVSPIRGMVIPTNEVTNKFWSPATGLWPNEVAKFEVLKQTECKNLKYNYDVPKEWLFNFGKTKE